MHSFAINTFNAENEADFEGFFDQRLLPYIKDNPAAASIFLQAW